MNAENRKRIVREIIESALPKLLEKAERAPETWDGFFLREMVADHMREQYACHKLGRSESREYNNDRSTYNL